MLYTQSNALIIRFVLVLSILSGSSSISFGQDVIQKGDYLRVTVIGHPYFDRQVRVENDGTITYPYLQGVPVTGMSPAKLQTMLLQILQKYIENPVVLVEILDKYTVQVNVLGQVENPGVIDIPAGLDVQSSISLAGGATDLADLSRVKVMRRTGKSESEWDEIKTDVNRFMLSGNLDSIPKLQEGDIVIVPGASSDSYVMVLGEVAAPGNYIPLPETSLLEMILLSGGHTEEANLKKVKLIRRVRPGESESTVINLQKLIKNEQFELIPNVRGGDVVVVPEQRHLLDWDRVNNLVRDVYLVIALYVIYIRVK